MFQGESTVHVFSTGRDNTRDRPGLSSKASHTLGRGVGVILNFPQDFLTLNNGIHFSKMTQSPGVMVIDGTMKAASFWVQAPLGEGIWGCLA